MALTDGIVSYWKLDESSGNASDSVSTNTLVNTNVTYGTGKIGNSAIGNSWNGTLKVSNNLGFTGNSDCSFVCWFYIPTRSVTGNRTLFSIRNSTTSNHFNCYYTVSKFYAGKVRRAALDAPSVATSGISAGVWHFLVIDYRHSGTSTSLQIDNGTKISITSSGNGYGESENLTILLGDGVYGTAGRLDMCGYYNRVLTTDERTTLYNGGAGLQYPFTTGIQKIYLGATQLESFKLGSTDIQKIYLGSTEVFSK